MIKYNLGWGHSVCVRQAFLANCSINPVTFSHPVLSGFDYPEHDGDPELVHITREIMRRQFGKEYKHVLLTNGATGGVVITLRAYAQKGATVAQTRRGPRYLRYPGMIKASGLKHSDESNWTTGDSVMLIDIPSNPLGLMDNPLTGMIAPIVFDGVYFNNVYTPGNLKVIPHNEFVGSYSKLLGLNGIRVGWIATDSDFMFERLRELVTSEYCGLDTASSMIIKNALKGFRWDLFESHARANLNFNREEWSKLERYFEGSPVSEYGMFYYGKMDSTCKKLMEKSGVHWTQGSLLGTNDGFGRFSLGQDCQLTREAVRSVLKNDGLL